MCNVHPPSPRLAKSLSIGIHLRIVHVKFHLNTSRSSKVTELFPKNFVLEPLCKFSNFLYFGIYFLCSSILFSQESNISPLVLDPDNLENWPLLVQKLCYWFGTTPELSYRSDMISNGSKLNVNTLCFLKKRRSLFRKYYFMHILVFIDPNVSNDFPVLPQLQKACYTRNFVRNIFCFWVLNLSLTLPQALTIKSFDTEAAKILPAHTFFRQIYNLSIFVWNLVLISVSYSWILNFWQHSCLDFFGLYMLSTLH